MAEFKSYEAEAERDAGLEAGELDATSPNTLTEILAATPANTHACDGGANNFETRLIGAWYGRCIGCCLGKPVEEPPWDRRNTRLYLEQTDAYPIADYIPRDGPLPQGMIRHWWWNETTRGGIHGMPRDDDIDFMILNLHALEMHGPNLTTENMAVEWLHHLPYGAIYTAERVTYRNLVNGVNPNEAGALENPYREWIGALIRADVFGYINPGRPLIASEFAYRDACLSHRGNGIYAEMWAAALVSAAFGCSSAKRAIEVAFGFIPSDCRLAEAIRTTVDIHTSGGSWDEAMNQIDDDRRYSWVHALNNSAALVAALLWGEGDFSRTIGLAVESGLDADSIGATAGSVFGALHGVSSIPEHWIAPIRGTVETAVAGEKGNTIEALVARTLAVEERLTRRCS